MGFVCLGFLENTKQSFLTSDTQVVMEHILEAPISKPRLLGRVTGMA